jgi:hypothetical protein
MLTQANGKEKRMRRYQFVVGVSLAALDEELDRTAGDDPSIALAQVFYAAGTGFVAVLERRGDSSRAEREYPEDSPRGKTAASPPRKRS